MSTQMSSNLFHRRYICSYTCRIRECILQSDVFQSGRHRSEITYI